MRTITKMLLTTVIAMMPLAALTDNATAKADTAKPAATALHGFDKYWSKMDPSGTGFVTKDHWMAHAADRFKEIDANGDGKISKEEMRAHDNKRHAHFMEMRHHRMMMHNQANGDKEGGE